MCLLPWVVLGSLPNSLFLFIVNGSATECVGWWGEKEEEEEEEVRKDEVFLVLLVVLLVLLVLFLVVVVVVGISLMTGLPPSIRRLSVKAQLGALVEGLKWRRK